MGDSIMLEACVDSVESAVAAAMGGAMRLELCSNLIIGGTTPGPWLFREIRKKTDIPVHVLIRPRFGDFCYTESEFEEMRSAVRMFRELGAEGAVFGVLKPDGRLDTARMALLKEAAGDMSVTLHRAFDVCSDPFDTLEEAVELGINTILTSGQKDTCTEGADLLRKLAEQSAGRIVIQAGSGVNADVIRNLYRRTEIRAYHMSGKVTLDSAMTYRKEGVHMGLPSLSEYEIWRTDEKKIREAREILDMYAGQE